MGHLGVLPQSATSFKFKGKETTERKVILRDSKLLEEAGVFSIVLECVESSLAKEVTKTINSSYRLALEPLHIVMGKF